MMNPICADCARLGNDCHGTTCKTWMGCVKKQPTDAAKTICKPKLIYQPDAPEEARYNVQLWHSDDGGKTFYYAGYGRFFKDYYDAEAWRKQKRKNLSYDLMFGHLGNGTTVSNRAREAYGDYQHIAHIDDCGAIRWYVDVRKLPPYVLEDVNAVALREMKKFKEKFLKLSKYAALDRVYNTFPVFVMANNLTKTTIEQLYEIYMDLICRHDYVLPHSNAV